MAAATGLRYLSRLRGRVGVGVPQRVRLFVGSEVPPPAALSSAATSPASGSDEGKWCPSAQFSTLILASRITGPHLSVSDFRKAANSAGVEPFGMAPSSSNLVLTAA